MRILKKIIVLFLIIILFLIGSAAALLYIYQDEIKKLFIAEVNKQINVSIDVENLELTLFQDFPNVTLLLQNIVVHNHPDFPTKKFPKLLHDDILQAPTLKLHADALELLKEKKIKIKNIEIVSGILIVLVDEKGNSNFELITKDKDASGQLNIEKIMAKNITVNYYQLANKANTILSNATLKIKLNQATENTIIEGSYTFDEIIFTQAKTNIQIQNIIGNARLFNNKEKLEIQMMNFSSNLGEFEVYNGFFTKDIYDIKLKFQHLKAKEIIPLIIEENLEKYAINTVFDGELALFSKNNKTSLKTFLETNNGLFNYENKQYTANNLKFSFTSVDITNASTYIFDVSEGQLLSNDLEATVKLNITDFNKKNLLMSANIKYKLYDYKNKNFQIDSCLLDLDLKNFSLSFPDSFNIKTGLNKELILKGKVSNLYGKFNKNYIVENMNGLFEIANNALTISNLNFTENNNTYKISAKTTDLMEVISNNSLKLKANISVDKFDLDYHLAQLKQTSEKSNFLFDLIINFQCNQFKYDLFKAHNVTGLITYTNNTINLIATEFYSCGGKIELNANLRTLENAHFIGSEIIIANIDIDSLFYSFRNFNQDFILDSHLKGKTTGTLLITSDFNNNYEFNWNRLNAELDFSIANGQLINFEPMENLSRFADVNELKHIKFSKLENTIFIKNQMVTIPLMDINSSAFNITISGTHAFDNNFSYHLQLLLSDIISKRRTNKNLDAEFGEIEDDGEGRTMLFLNIEGTPDDYKVKYDRKRAREKVSDDFKTEKKELRDIFKEEFKIFRKDTTLRKLNDENNEPFIIEWEDDDKLN